MRYRQLFFTTLPMTSPLLPLELSILFTSSSHLNVWYANFHSPTHCRGMQRRWVKIMKCYRSIAEDICSRQLPKSPWVTCNTAPTSHPWQLPHLPYWPHRPLTVASAAISGVAVTNPFPILSPSKSPHAVTLSRSFVSGSVLSLDHSYVSQRHLFFVIHTMFTRPNWIDKIGRAPWKIYFQSYYKYSLRFRISGLMAY